MCKYLTKPIELIQLTLSFQQLYSNVLHFNSLEDNNGFYTRLNMKYHINKCIYVTKHSLLSLDVSNLVFITPNSSYMITTHFCHM